MPHKVVATGYLKSYPEFSDVRSNEDDPVSNCHLAWMLTQVCSDEMSETKANRWLGYVQGVMVMKGMLSVSHERERTRAIFNGA